LQVARFSSSHYSLPYREKWIRKRMKDNQSSNVVYRSRVRIERKQGPIRLAHLPAETTPVTFGVHGEVAKHYDVSPGAHEPRATTLDYVVAAAAG